MLGMTPTFDTLSTMEKESIAASVENVMNENVNGISSVNVAELKGLLRFNEHIKAIQGGGFDIDEEALYLAVRNKSISVLNIESITYFSENAGDLDWDDDGINNDQDNCPLSYNPDQLDYDNDGVGNACDESVFDVIVAGRDNDFASRDCQFHNVENWTNIKTVNIKEFGSSTITIQRMIDDIKLSIKPMCESGLKVKVVIIDKRCSVNKFNDAIDYVQHFDYGMVISIFQFKLKRSYIKDQIEVFVYDAKKLKTIPYPNGAGTLGGKLVFKSLFSDSAITIDKVPFIGGFTEYIPFNFESKDAVCKGFGYNGSLNGTWVVAGGFNGSLGAQTIVFTEGDYAWFPYVYAFEEITPAIGYNPFEISLSSEFVIVAKYGNKSYYPKPIDLNGKYSVLFGVDAGTKGLKVGITSQINVPYKPDSTVMIEDENKWVSASIGTSIGLSDPSFPISVTLKSSEAIKYITDKNVPASARMDLVSIPIKTKDINGFVILINWVNFAYEISPMSIFTKAGDVVEIFILKALNKKNE